MKTAPTPTKDTETRLREAIQRELMRCDRNVTPAVCKRTSTLEGYKYVEDTIINMVIGQGLMPSACIAQLESEWSTE